MADLTPQEIAAMDNYAKAQGKTVADLPTPTTAPASAGSDVTSAESAAMARYAASQGKTVAELPTTPSTGTSPIVSYIQQRSGQLAPDKRWDCGKGIECMLGMPMGGGGIQSLRQDKNNLVQPDANGRVPDGTGVWFGGDSSGQKHYVIAYTDPKDGIQKAAEVRWNGPGTPYHFDTTRSLASIANESDHRGKPIVYFKLPSTGVNAGGRQAPPVTPSTGRNVPMTPIIPPPAPGQIPVGMATSQVGWFLRDYKGPMTPNLLKYLKSYASADSLIPPLNAGLSAVTKLANAGGSRSTIAPLPPPDQSSLTDDIRRFSAVNPANAKPSRQMVNGISMVTFYKANGQPMAPIFYGGGKPGDADYGKRLASSDSRVAATIGAVHPSVGDVGAQQIEDIGARMQSNAVKNKMASLGGTFDQYLLGGLLKGVPSVVQGTAKFAQDAGLGQPMNVLRLSIDPAQMQANIAFTNTIGQQQQQAFHEDIKGLIPTDLVTKLYNGGNPNVKNLQKVIKGEIDYAGDNPLIAILNVLPVAEGVGKLSTVGARVASRIGTDGMARLGDSVLAQAAKTTDAATASALTAKGYQYHQIAAALKSGKPLGAAQFALGYKGPDLTTGKTIAETTGYKGAPDAITAPAGQPVDAAPVAPYAPKIGANGKPTIKTLQTKAPEVSRGKTFGATEPKGTPSIVLKDGREVNLSPDSKISDDGHVTGSDGKQYHHGDIAKVKDADGNVIWTAPDAKPAETPHHSTTQPRDTDGTFVEGKPETPTPLPSKPTVKDDGKVVTMQVQGETKQAVLTAYQAKEWDKEQQRYADTQEFNKRQFAIHKDQQKFDAAQKAAAMQNAANRRQISGLLTPTEAKAISDREATNYVGKSVTVDGRPGKVIGNPFGKVKVKFDDGTEAIHPPEKVKAVPKPPAVKPTISVPMATAEAAPKVAPVEAPASTGGSPVDVHGMRMSDLEDAAKKIGIRLPDRSTFSETWDQVKARANANYIDIKDSLKLYNAERNPNLTNEETYVGHTALRQLTEKTIPDLLTKIESVDPKANPEAHARLQGRLSVAMADADKLSNTLYRSASSAGRRLAFQKAVVDGPLDSASILRKAQAAANGKLSGAAQTSIIRTVAKAKVIEKTLSERSQASADAALKRLESFDFSKIKADALKGCK